MHFLYFKHPDRVATIGMLLTLLFPPALLVLALGSALHAPFGVREFLFSPFVVRIASGVYAVVPLIGDILVRTARRQIGGSDADNTKLARLLMTVIAVTLALYTFVSGSPPLIEKIGEAQQFWER